MSRPEMSARSAMSLRVGSTDSTLPEYQAEMSSTEKEVAGTRPLPSRASMIMRLVYFCGLVYIGVPTLRSAAYRYFLWYWKTSGDFCQSQWDKFIYMTDNDLFMVWSVWMFIITTSVYWLVGGLYTLMDVTNKPAFLRKYKVQPGTNEPVERDKLIQAIKTVLFNQICVGIPLGLINYAGLLLKGVPEDSMKLLPSFIELVLHILFCFVVREAAFYYSHRWLHSKMLYKHVHKKHHEWTAPIAIVAIYCHPLEHVLSNIVPAALGVTILNSHPFTAYLWLSFVTLETLNAHSGYHMPFLPSPELHDYHHLKFTECFGGLILFFDWIHKTDTNFRASKAVSKKLN